MTSWTNDLDTMHVKALPLLYLTNIALTNQSGRAGGCMVKLSARGSEVRNVVIPESTNFLTNSSGHQLLYALVSYVRHDSKTWMQAS